MIRIHSLVLSSLVTLTLVGCDKTPETAPAPTPIAPVAVPVAAPPEAAPAAPAAPEHAAKPAAKHEKDEKAEPATPDVAPPVKAEVPADMKDKEAKGVVGEEKGVMKGNRALPPPQAPLADAPVAAPARNEAVGGGRPGRGIPAAFEAKPDAGK